MLLQMPELPKNSYSCTVNSSYLTSLITTNHAKVSCNGIEPSRVLNIGSGYFLEGSQQSNA